MSTYTIPVSGPSPRLAMLRALALKAAHRVGQLLTAVKVTLTRGTHLVRTAASAVLAIVGSEAGYQLVRHAVRTVATTTATAVKAGLRLLGRGLKFLARTARTAIALVSPTAADVVERKAGDWIVEPVAHVATTISTWMGNVAQLGWELSDSSLVKAVTVRAAQVAGLILAIHSLSQGAVASRIVQALPWLMDTVLWITSPVKALALVATGFLAALAFTAVRLLGSGNDPEPTEPATAPEPVLDPGTPLLVAEPHPIEQPSFDLEKVAASVNVEVAPDGSVLVHGIPGDLPEDVALQVARIAADAATARLEKVLLHRAVPNRDDRRLLTKSAREALRAEGRRKARATA